MSVRTNELGRITLWFGQCCYKYENVIGDDFITLRWITRIVGVCTP